MVYDYLVTLKKPDYRFVDQVSQLLYLFALLAFGYFYYLLPQKNVFYPIICTAILVCWVYLFQKKKKKGQVFFRLGMFVCAIGWVAGSQVNVWMALLYAVAGILEKQVKFPQEIGFSEKEIYFNTVPKKVMQWNEMNNVIIKDGLITIDRSNNKIFQKEIEGFVTADIENEFNEFCKRYITGSKENKV